MPCKICVYMIEVPASDKPFRCYQYFGSTKRFDVRRRSHFRELATGNHHNEPMQRLHDKYGVDDWRVAIVRECSTVAEARQYEQILLDIAYGLPSNLNTRPDTRVVTKPWTAERRKRMEAIYADPEWKAKHSRRMKEILNRPEVQRNRAATCEARRRDPSWLAKAEERSLAAKQRLSDPSVRRKMSRKAKSLHRESSHVRDASSERQSRRISVEDVTTGEVLEFSSTRAAGEHFAIPEATFTMNLTGRSRLVRGKYKARYLEASPINRTFAVHPDLPVFVKNSKTGQTREFQSVAEAAEVLDTSPRAIRDNIAGKTKLLKRLYSVEYLDN